jgi:glyoxylase-like metal-dependent hydrolase (beta-lactamase superfamily II)
LKVADGVYVALNYAIANCIMLLGPDGKVIVDTTESLQAAEEIAAEFRNITEAETKAIIYTHHHTDHISGSWVSDTNVI